MAVTLLTSHRHHYYYTQLVFYISFYKKMKFILTSSFQTLIDIMLQINYTYEVLFLL